MLKYYVFFCLPNRIFNRWISWKEVIRDYLILKILAADNFHVFRTCAMNLFTVSNFVSIYG